MQNISCSAKGEGWFNGSESGSWLSRNRPLLHCFWLYPLCDFTSSSLCHFVSSVFTVCLESLQAGCLLICDIYKCQVTTCCLTRATRLSVNILSLLVWLLESVCLLLIHAYLYFGYLYMPSISSQELQVGVLYQGSEHALYFLNKILYLSTAVGVQVMLLFWIVVAVPIFSQNIPSSCV